MTLKEKRIYKRITRAILAKNDYDHRKGIKRYTYDLEDAYLHYFPSISKILHSKKGLVFKLKNDELTCWFLLPDLQSLLKEVEQPL